MIRFFALCTSAVLMLACAPMPDPAARRPAKPPAEGVLLLSLKTGAAVGQRALGQDPLAVALAPDGKTAYVADNDLGDVFALRLPSLQLRWRSHVGGAPGPMLVDGSELWVSEYDAGVAADLDGATGRQLATQDVGAHPGELALQDGHVRAAGGRGFGFALAGGKPWTYAELPPLPGLKPFWLEPGRGGELLVTEEGVPEDTAPGAVLAIDTTRGGAPSEIAAPRDPDCVARSGQDVFIAAHGDGDVLVARGGERLRWAVGSEPVALAPDPGLGVLVVVTDADE